MGDAQRVGIEQLLGESAWVRALAESLVRDPAAADDIVQQTWLAALRSPPDAGRALRPWLRAVVENFARMRRRSEASRAAREEHAAREEQLAAPEELLERIETQRALAALVLELEEPLRSVVVLRFYEGLSSVEIGQRVGVSDGTVRWQLKRGLEKLRERLDRKHGGDRRAWTALLAPLCRPRAAPTLAGGLLAALVLLAVLASGVVVWRATSTEHRSAVELATHGDDARAEGELAGTPRRPVATEVTPNAGPVLPWLSALLADEQGVPLAGAELVLDESSALSGSDGWARMSGGQPEGSWLVATARAVGRVPRVVAFENSVPRVTNLGELRLARAGTLAGRVVDESGRALAGAVVRAERLGSRWLTLEEPPLEEARAMGSLLPADTPQALTDVHGRFEIDALPECFVRLWVSAAGFETSWSEPLSVLGGALADAGELVARARDPLEVLSGRVVDAHGQPVPHAMLEAARQSIRAEFFGDSSQVIRARADEAGRFAIEVDARSTFELAAADARLELRPMVLGSLGAGTQGLELQLSEWRAFEVHARRSDGAAIRELELEFRDARNARPLTAETERWASGRHVAPFVDFTVVVRSRGCAQALLGPFGRDSAPHTAEVELQAAAALSGVVRAGGAPLAGAQLELIAASNAARGGPLALGTLDAPFVGLVDRAWRAQRVRSDEHGAYELALLEPGTWFLRVEASGHAVDWSGPYELGPMSRIAHDVELVRGAALRGRVIDARGAALAGVVVGVSMGDGFVRTQRSASDGQFEFDSLCAGRWQVRRVAEEVRGWSRLDWSPSGAAAPRWDVELSSSLDAEYTLIAEHRESARCEGRLTFDGAPAGPWIVEAAAPGAARARGVVGPRGTFELELAGAGDWSLRARLAERGGPTWELRERMVIERVARWERDLATGSLELRAASAGSESSVRIEWSDARGLSATLTAPITAGAVLHLERVPAGQLSLTLDERAPVVLTLSARAALAVEL
ncbi:MAG: sigma-70 family RNA polymerase sigma factor [Planctomycetes bacterium]|nr:sigma-70 family RNA polymerase sigma factor [Planctomycetota bacterium]